MSFGAFYGRFWYGGAEYGWLYPSSGAKYGRVYPYSLMVIPIICNLTSTYAQDTMQKKSGLPQVMQLRAITSTGGSEGRVKVRAKSKDSFQNT